MNTASKEIPIPKEQMGITWEQLRQAIDAFLQEHGIPTNTEIEYIDFSWSGGGGRIGVYYSNGRLVVQ